MLISLVEFIMARVSFCTCKGQNHLRMNRKKNTNGTINFEIFYFNFTPLNDTQPLFCSSYSSLHFELAINHYIALFLRLISFFLVFIALTFSTWFVSHLLSEKKIIIHELEKSYEERKIDVWWLFSLVQMKVVCDV